MFTSAGIGKIPVGIQLEPVGTSWLQPVSPAVPALVNILMTYVVLGQIAVHVNCLLMADCNQTST